MKPVKHKKFIKDLYPINGKTLSKLKFYEKPRHIKIDYADGLSIEIEKPYKISSSKSAKTEIDKKIKFFDTYIVVEKEEIRTPVTILEGYSVGRGIFVMYIYCNRCKKYTEKIFFDREDGEFKCSKCHGLKSANNFGDMVFDRKWARVRNWCKKSGGKIGTNGMCVWDDKIFIEKPELIDLKIKCLIREKSFFDAVNARYNRIRYNRIMRQKKDE